MRGTARWESGFVSFSASEHTFQHLGGRERNVCSEESASELSCCLEHNHTRLNLDFELMAWPYLMQTGVSVVVCQLLLNYPN